MNPTAEAFRLRPGSHVRVRLDDGTDWYTTARSEPWQSDSGHWLIRLKGKPGGCALERCTPVSEGQALHAAAKA